jgi:hypothetical protein
MNETTLAQAQQALARGDKAGARAILAPVVRADPSDGQAWLLLSETVDDVAQKRDCLQRALRAQPDNAAARSALARLDAPTVAPNASQPAIPAPVNPTPASQPAPEPDAFAAPLRPLVAPGPEHQAPAGPRPGPVYGLPGSAATSSSAPARKSPLATILIGVGAGLVLGALVILGVFLFRDGRSTGGSSSAAAPTESAASAPAATPTRRAQRPTATPDFSQPGGVLVSPVPGQPTETPLPEDKIPPSLPISELVPFTHEPTGITGLRPANWEIFSGPTSFQVSSSPPAPDGFIGKLVPPKEYDEGSAAATTRKLFDSLKVNTAEGPAPVITTETYNEDGSGILLVESTGNAQGSDKPFRFTIYGRTTVTPGGLLISFAIVPTELYAGEAELVRQMVDSLTIK